MVPDAHPQKTRKQIENELMEVLRERQREWKAAGEDIRGIARQRFMNALDVSYALVLYGKLPGE
jgi:hypothetical protein